MGATTKLLFTSKVSLPPPILVMGVMLALRAVVETVTLPAPAKVRPKAPLMPPVMVSVSLSEPMADALPRVIAPAQVLLPEMFCKAPPVLMPVPLIVSASVS